MTSEDLPYSWEDRWRSEAGRADWVTPEQEVIELAEKLVAQGAKRALDLGCGVGRHALALALTGLDVEAFDSSAAGLEHVRSEAERYQLGIATHAGDIGALPFEDARFDLIVSWNVIYHCDDKEIRRAISEIHRILKPGGTVHATLLSKRHSDYGIGKEISPNFWIDPNADPDSAHPHYFADAKDAIDLFGNFDIRSLNDIEQRNKPGNGHWHIVAERLN